MGVVPGLNFGKHGLRASRSFLKKILINSDRLVTFHAEYRRPGRTKEARFEHVGATQNAIYRSLSFGVQPSGPLSSCPAAAVTTDHKLRALKQRIRFLSYTYCLKTPKSKRVSL